LETISYKKLKVDDKNSREEHKIVNVQRKGIPNGEDDYTSSFSSSAYGQTSTS